MTALTATHEEEQQALTGFRAPWRLLSVVSLGAVLAPLNSTMIAVALPVIRSEFGISHAASGWLVSSYLIAMAVTQPLAGRLGDQLGRERLFRAGLVAFLACSLAAAIVPGFVLVLLFRVLQAVAGAVVIPNGIGMLREGVPAERFGRYSGFNSAVLGGTAAAGPLLGGAILALGSWRLLFILNVPVVLAALWLLRGLPARPRSGTRDTARTGVDFLGFALFAATLVAATLLAGSSRAHSLPLALAAGAGTVLTGAAFAWRQRRTRWPAAEWRLFRVPSFVGASSHILLMNLAMYTTLLAIPFFLNDVQGRDAAAAGLLLGGMAALQALTAPFAGGISDRLGRRAPLVASSAISLAAITMVVVGLSASTPLWYLAVAMIVLGLGVGIGFVVASAAAVESAPRALSSGAAGTQAMMRYLGSIVGAGVLAGLLNTQGDPPGVETFRLLFVGVLAMVALSLVAAAMVAARPRED